MSSGWMMPCSRMDSGQFFQRGGVKEGARLLGIGRDVVQRDIAHTVARHADFVHIGKGVRGCGRLGVYDECAQPAS